MSGIFGLVGQDPRRNEDAFRAMEGATLRSGSLRQASLSKPGAVFGLFQRWGFQTAAEQGDLLVAADADLVNLSEIQELLGCSNCENPGNSSQIVARLYQRYGTDFVQHLRGGFAVAVWDQAKRQLILAIDRLGIKGLYWTHQNGIFAFGRHARQVTAVQEQARPNRQAIAEYLILSVVPAPRSAFEGVEKMRPGHLLTFGGGEVLHRQYWDLGYDEDPTLSEAEWAVRLRDGMRGAVHRHLEGYSPEKLGAYLSGGTDSSSVVAFMSDRFASANTFSVGFREASYDESEFARTTAATFSTNHHECLISEQDAIAAIPPIMAQFDEPFANSSAVGGYFCAKYAAERGIETLLAGDGGDELFAGNSRYADDRKFSAYQDLPQWIRKRLIEPAVGLLPASGKLSLPARYIRRSNISNPDRMLSYSLFLSMPPEKIFEPEFLRAAPSSEWMETCRAHFRNAKASTELNRLLYFDVKVTLADNDLRKVNGTAELAGVNVRYPLLDHTLAELSGKIPTGLKLRGLEKRYLFKRAMKGILPDKVLYKKKHGFGVPLSHWLLKSPQLGDLVADTLSDRQTRERGYFHSSFIQELRRMHREAHTGFYGEVVWYILALEMWHRNHVVPKSEAALAY